MNVDARRKFITQCTSACYIVIQMLIVFFVVISLPLWGTSACYILIGLLFLCIIGPPVITWGNSDLFDYFYELIP